MMKIKLSKRNHELLAREKVSIKLNILWRHCYCCQWRIAFWDWFVFRCFAWLFGTTLCSSYTTLYGPVFCKTTVFCASLWAATWPGSCFACGDPHIFVETAPTAYRSQANPNQSCLQQQLPQLQDSEESMKDEYLSKSNNAVIMWTLMSSLKIIMHISNIKPAS